MKVKTKKVNKLSTNIPTCYITELNELIYAKAKLVCDKICFPEKKLKQKYKKLPGKKKKTKKKKIRNLCQQAKALRKEKKTKNILRWKYQNKINLEIQREEMNQKILTTEWRIKRYWNRVKPYKQKRTLEIIQKILFTGWWRMYEDKPTTVCNGSKTILV